MKMMLESRLKSFISFFVVIFIVLVIYYCISSTRDDQSPVGLQRKVRNIWAHLPYFNHIPNLESITTTCHHPSTCPTTCPTTTCHRPTTCTTTCPTTTCPTTTCKTTTCPTTTCPTTTCPTTTCPTTTCHRPKTCPTTCPTTTCHRPTTCTTTCPTTTCHHPTTCTTTCPTTTCHHPTTCTTTCPTTTCHQPNTCTTTCRNPTTCDHSTTRHHPSRTNKKSTTKKRKFNGNALRPSSARNISRNTTNKASSRFNRTTMLISKVGTTLENISFTPRTLYLEKKERLGNYIKTSFVLPRRKLSIIPMGTTVERRKVPKLTSPPAHVSLALGVHTTKTNKSRHNESIAKPNSDETDVSHDVSVNAVQHMPLTSDDHLMKIDLHSLILGLLANNMTFDVSHEYDGNSKKVNDAVHVTIM